SEDPQSFAVLGWRRCLPAESDAGQEGDPCFGVEHSDCETACSHVDSEFKIESSSRVRWWHPGTDPCGARGRVDGGWGAQTRRNRRLLILVTTPSFTSTAGLALVLAGLSRYCWRGSRTRRLIARLVSHIDQQSRNVLAVLSVRGNRRTAAARCDSFSTQTNDDVVRFGVRSADGAGRLGLVDYNLFDDLSLFVVKAA